MSTQRAKVGERYEIVRRLGGGSQGETFLGRCDDGEVVLKRFSIREMRGWKSLELFRREIATLGMLDHPSIPDFIDDVEFDGSHYLVQEYIDGDVLSEVVARGPLADSELRAVTADVLEVLAYLHALNPPVVHRDVKPSNIIRRPDGTHALVDFGGVQMIVARDTGGSTVIGTTGYMPSEQLVGRAVPQSDLYALGATLAHLATGVRPSELPTKRLRIDWRDQAGDVSAPLANLIDEMLNPAPEDRPASAQAALASLHSSTALAETSTGDITRLSPVAVSMQRRISRTPQRLELVLTEGNEGVWPVAATVGVVGVLMIIFISAPVVRLVVGAALTLLAFLTRRMTVGSYKLVVQADGHSWVRVHDERGIRLIRGVLEFDDGKLFIDDADTIEREQVATSLSPEEAAWLAEEAKAFIESSNRTAAPVVRPQPAAEPPPTLDVETESDDEPIADPASEPFVEALPDRDSKFDQGVHDDALLKLRRPTVGRVSGAIRPVGPCPPSVTDRVDKHGDVLCLDLAPRFDIATVVFGFTLMGICAVFAIVLRIWFFAGVGLTIGVMGLVVIAVRGGAQQLDVYRDGSFVFRTDHKSESRSGVLVPQVWLDEDVVRVETVGDEDLLIASSLHNFERPWIGFLVSDWITDEDEDE